MTALAIILIAGGVTAAPQAPKSPETLVDRVIAVVDKEVLTQSELLIEARIALVRQKGTHALAALDGEVNPVLLISFRDLVVNQILISHQIRRLGTVDIPEEQIERALAEFGRVFTSAAAYEAFKRKYGIPEGVIRDILRRDMRNDAYVAQRMRSWLSTTVGVTQRERYDRALAAYLEEVRRSVEIRLLGPQGELELQ